MSQTQIEKTPALTREAVIELTGNVVNAWNRGDLEGVCGAYAPDASFVTREGSVRGRKSIFEHYRRAYPDSSSMGSLSLTLTEFWSAPVCPPYEATMASATLEWKLGDPNGQTSSGFSLVVFTKRGGMIEIVQDLSVERASAFKDPNLKLEGERAYWKGKRVGLSRREYWVVETLVQHAPRDVTYRELYDVFRRPGLQAGRGEKGFHANVRCLIRRIRRAFQDIDPNFATIKNYPGHGYRWES